MKQPWVEVDITREHFLQAQQQGLNPISVACEAHFGAGLQWASRSHGVEIGAQGQPVFPCTLLLQWRNGQGLQVLRVSKRVEALTASNRVWPGAYRIRLDFELGKVRACGPVVAEEV
jgi:hypothetical protein